MAHKDQLPGGLADEKSPQDFNPKQLAKGIKVELEHTKDKELATEIAMDHLMEDPNYYDKLMMMESIARMARYQSQIKKAHQSSEQVLYSLLPTLTKAVQQEYDQWDQSDEEYGDPELGFGGICQNFADIIAEVIQEKTPFDTATMSATIGEQHVWAIVQTPDGIYRVDIPYCVYETGGGYSWQKKTDVKFTPENFIIDLVESNPDNWGEFLED